MCLLVQKHPLHLSAARRTAARSSIMPLKRSYDDAVRQNRSSSRCDDSAQAVPVDSSLQPTLSETAHGKQRRLSFVDENGDRASASTSSRPCTPPIPENIHPLWGRALMPGNEFTAPPDPSGFYLESPVRPRQPSPPPPFLDFTGIENLVPPSFPSWYETAEARGLEPLSLRSAY